METSNAKEKHFLTMQHSHCSHIPGFSILLQAWLKNNPEHHNPVFKKSEFHFAQENGIACRQEMRALQSK